MTLGWPAGLRVIEKDITASTNADALALAATTDDALTLILARRQTAGRGRLNRHWVSADGNLFASFLVRLPESAGPASFLVFVSALATWRTLRIFTPVGHDVRLKWPNDTLIDGRKASGILIESAGNFAAVGIGINITSHPETGALYAATSLAAYRPPPTRDEVAQELARQFLHCLSQWQMGSLEGVRPDYLAAAWRFGEIISIATPQQTLTGRFADIDAFGLILQLPDGTRTRVAAGDMLQG